MIFRKSQEPDEYKQKVKKEKKDEDGLEWDKKKVGIFAIIATVIVIAGVELKGTFYDKNKNVLGDAVRNKPVSLERPDVKVPIDLSAELGSKVSEIKKNIEGLDANEIASSSPQIQKLLNDMSKLQDLPANQVKETCQKICSGI